MRSSIAISQQLIQARHRKTIRKNIIVLSVLSFCFFVDLNEAITCLLFLKKRGLFEGHCTFNTLIHTYESVISYRIIVNYKGRYINRCIVYK